METDQQQQQDSIHENIASIARNLSLPVPDNVDNAFLSLFKTKLIELASESKKHKELPNLLLPSNSSSLNDQEWVKFGKFIDLMNADYAERALLLKKRAEVTIDSFLWSDRVKQMEDKIRQVLDGSGFTNVCFDPVHIDDVLTANSGLLYVTKTSDAQLRQGTRNFVMDHRVKADIVPDRGGRTEQIQPMQRETFQQQEAQRHQQQFRGGDRHAAGGGSFRGRSKDGGGAGWKDGNRVQSGAAGASGGGWHPGGYGRGGGRAKEKRGRYN